MRKHDDEFFLSNSFLTCWTRKQKLSLENWPRFLYKPVISANLQK